MRDGPLAGVTVLDLSTAIAAPMACTLLGDFGADVIKVEQPGAGDYMRNFSEQPEPGGRSLFWLQEGRNRRSITIDLRSPEGQDLVRRLVGTVDVVVTNFRPATLESWGLSPESMLRAHPRAVITAVTGYGLTGPLRERGAFDRIASAFSGLTQVSGEAAHAPVRTGYSVIDYMTGYLAAFATVVALRHREQGGPGQIVDLALYEAAFRASENALLDFVVHGRERTRSGNHTRHIVPAGDFDTADGRRVSIHAGTEPLFGRLTEAMGRPDLREHPSYATLAARHVHQEELYEEIGVWAARHAADDLVQLLSDHEVPASVLMSIADIATDPHYLDRGTIVPVKDEEWGDLLMVAPLPHLSATPGRIDSLGPALGAHTDEVLSGLLGLSTDELEQLRRQQVL
jgi:crotonobetainyl-CoA:carnitine CoA-transferase CaiB-like acyl-CoA transferase